LKTSTQSQASDTVHAVPTKRLVLRRENVRNLGIRSGVRTGSGLVGASNSVASSPSFAGSGSVYSAGGPHVSGGSSVISISTDGY